jgi:hypothetical protein
MRLVYALTVGFFVVVVAVASYFTFSGGDDDAQTASKITPAERKPVKVVISGTNDAKEAVVDCGIVGEGTFRATGGITDRGSVRANRCMPNEDLIVLRFIAKGTRGTITYHVAIHIDQRPVVARWKIESATKAYKGLQGEGKEYEDPPIYSVVWLKGKVWR